jgi:hypothetical protein
MGFQLLFRALCFVAIYAAVIGVVAGAVFCVLRLLNKKPSFIICCAIAVCLMGVLSMFVATFPWR